MAATTTPIPVYTVKDVKQLAKDLLDAETNDYWSDAEQTRWINQANLYVYRKLIKTNPELFLSVTDVSVPSNADFLTITDAAPNGLGEEPYKILAVVEKPTSGAVSNSNRPWDWLPMRFTERSQRHRQASSLGNWSTTYYCLQGDRFYVAPTPGNGRTIEIAWIPKPLELKHDTSDDDPNDEVLNGKAEAWGDAVAYRLAWLMNAKQDGDNPIVQQLWAETEMQLEGTANTRTIQRPRRVITRRSG